MAGRRNWKINMWHLQKKIIVNFIKRKIENNEPTVEDVYAKWDNQEISLDAFVKKISSKKVA